MARKVFIAGNWKMNTTLKEAVELAKGVVSAIGNNNVIDVALCVPYISLSAVAEVVKNTPVLLGAQDVHWEKSGAYTGKISCEMLKSVGVTCVIIGHSEQRSYFHETDETVNKKIKAALEAGIIPILCVGETLEERKSGRMESVVTTQINGAFAGISKQDALKFIIAYEPVWAIGTGETATPHQANEAHIFIRKLILNSYDKETAQGLRIIYGGSMKPDNAKDLLDQSDVDGGLIGGASLKADSFIKIIKPN